MKSILARKSTSRILLALIFAFAIVAGAALEKRSESAPTAPRAESDGTIAQADPCAVTRETREVRGGSLSGIIASGASIEVLVGYYACHPVLRNDIVMYRYGGNPEPIIKIVRGVPGDALKLQKEGAVWRIVVNGKVLATSGGAPYALGDAAHRILSLYVPEGGVVIASSTYLIFGNLAEGSVDSTRFGLVDVSDILGKVEP